jgi:hypothetical protein
MTIDDAEKFQTYWKQFIYEGRQFVLFCHVKISQTMAFHATLLVSLESS